MKKPISDMTAQEFVEIAAALGAKHIELAHKLDRSQCTISQYSTGAKRIPVEITQRLAELVDARAKYLSQLRGRTFAARDIGALVVETNLIRQAAETPRPDNQYRLCRRLTMDTRLYPAYRIRQDRVLLYARALRAWRDEVERRLRTVLDDKNHIKMHRLELTDLKMLFDTVPRTLPYDILVTRTEWQVAARALRWYYSLDPGANASAYAFYQHWRKHKEAGYPYKRQIVVAQQEVAP